MGKILIFAGTREGRELSEILSKEKIPHGISVATKYASDLLNDDGFTKVYCDRMNKDEMSDLFENEKYSVIVDATHPYAYEVSKNIKDAIEGKGITYIRLKRDMGEFEENDSIRFFDSNEECAKALLNESGNILLTTGSKELNVYAREDKLRERLFVRVIPNEESLAICRENEILSKNIIAMQGPFTLEMNEAIVDMYDISVMVSKQSGINGGFIEKVNCATKKGIPLFVIGCMEKGEGAGLKETIEKINEICGINISFNTGLNINLIGIGTGNENELTRSASEAIKKADHIFGAKRLIETVSKEKAQKKAIYNPKDIYEELKNICNSECRETVNVAILFSGDASFYSGAGKVYSLLSDEINKGAFCAKVNIIPGISSVSYFASRIGVPYSDCNLFSMHGKKIDNIARKIENKKRFFLLVSGCGDIKEIGKKCVEAGLENVSVTVGYNLSYEDEKIVRLNPKECMEFDSEGLIIALIENGSNKERRVSHGISDDDFIRDKVPMTKEEIREVSICKLGLRKNSVLWDIGSGTGTISVEAALLSDDVKVYAFEKKEDAYLLSDRNIKKYNLENIILINGEAPDDFEKAKMYDGFVNTRKPTHAFIGGSGGRLKEILLKLYEINPNMRVVINAVTLETVSELGKVGEYLKIRNFEVLTLQVSKAQKAGDYNLMKADNPVWICSFDFCE